ncbi:hypothetical protein [Aeromonas veronii]|uniref:hypothetical protein n=1 Tax=Aeromonas veronii TaxID=654 RepID=UPI0035B920E3
MSARVDEIIRQILVLSNDEKIELLQKIRKGVPGVGIENRGGGFLGESTGFTTINFAPTPRGCPRCGK